MMLAIVQRDCRKKHLAVTHPGMVVWDTLGCNRELPHDGTSFTPIDMARGSIATDDTDVCVYCLRLLAFAHVLLRNPAFTEPRRQLEAVS